MAGLDLRTEKKVLCLSMSISSIPARNEWIMLSSVLMCLAEWQIEADSLDTINQSLQMYIPPHDVKGLVISQETEH